MAVLVILFRLGKANHAKLIGQFTIDLVGKRNWDEELPIFMSAPPEPEDVEAVMPLLDQAVLIIKFYDPASSGFLEGIMSMMD